MKQIFLTLTLLLLTILPAGAVKKITPNPINLAIILVEKTDSTKVASTLEYYGYSPQGKEDGYQIMKDPNGNEIRYSFTNNNSHSNYPTVVVKAKDTHKALDYKLKELNFEKAGNGYERMKNPYSKYKIRCGFGSNNVLVVQRIQN